MQAPRDVTRLAELEHRHLKSAAPQLMFLAELSMHPYAHDGIWATRPARLVDDTLGAEVEKVGVLKLEKDWAEMPATRAESESVAKCMMMDTVPTMFQMRRCAGSTIDGDN